MSDEAVDQLRVLIHAPVGKDGKMIAEVLARAEIKAEPCPKLETVSYELDRGVGALIIADDSLRRSGIVPIAEWLHQQPRWSDLPIIIMTTGGEANPTSIHRLRLIDPLGNVTLIERPVRRVTLVSTVRTALRARKRQYEIRDYLEELRRSEERLRDAIIEAPIPIIVHTEDGEVLYISRAWTEITGYLREDIPTIQAWAEKALSPEGAAALSQASSPEPDQDHRSRTELDIVTKDGKTRTWVFSASRLSPLLDGRRLLISAAMDITERNAMIEALRQANADLEQFAYAAAHDLQEPIRNLSLTTQLFAKRYNGQLGNGVDEFIASTVESSHRIHDLIQDLLAYTRAVNPLPDEHNVDANEVIREVMEDLKVPIQETAARISYSGLPQVPLPRVQLLQVLQNLIGNALKYRSQEPPRITVSTERTEKEWVFMVRDNGVGIAPEHHARIFKVFKRLHGRDIPGTGIGLAICQRIIGHHGGRIWVESVPGAGATFFFTIPFRRPV